MGIPPPCCSRFGPIRANARNYGTVSDRTTMTTIARPGAGCGLNGGLDLARRRGYPVNPSRNQRALVWSPGAPGTRLTVPPPLRK